MCILVMWLINAINLWLPWTAGNVLTSCTTASFSTGFLLHVFCNSVRCKWKLYVLDIRMVAGSWLRSPRVTDVIKSHTISRVSWKTKFEYRLSEPARNDYGYTIVSSYIICSLHEILLGLSNQGVWGGRNMYHTWERWRLCKIFQSELWK